MLWKNSFFCSQSLYQTILRQCTRNRGKKKEIISWWMLKIRVLTLVLVILNKRKMIITQHVNNCFLTTLRWMIQYLDWDTSVSRTVLTAYPVNYMLKTFVIKTDDSFHVFIRLFNRYYTTDQRHVKSKRLDSSQRYTSRSPWRHSICMKK